MRRSHKARSRLTAQLLLLSPAVAKHEQPEQCAEAGDRKMQEGRYLEAVDQYSRAFKNETTNPNCHKIHGRPEVPIQ